MKTQKPGWKTTEFWLSLLVVLFGVGTAAGAVGETGIIAKVVGLGVAALGAMGYAFVRSKIKKREGSKKPGWKTTEFWLSLAAIIVAMLAASGAIADGSTLAKVVGLIAGALAAMGYTNGRGVVKTPGDFDKTDKDGAPISILEEL